MGKVRTPGGRRAFREADALHDKVEFLEQENLDLMLEVKALKVAASRAAAASPRPAPRADENAAPLLAKSPAPLAKSPAPLVAATPASSPFAIHADGAASAAPENTQECNQS